MLRILPDFSFENLGNFNDMFSLMSDTKLASPPEQLTETMVFFSNLPLKFKTFRLSKNNSKSSTSIIPSLFKKADEMSESPVIEAVWEKLCFLLKSVLPDFRTIIGILCCNATKAIFSNFSISLKPSTYIPIALTLLSLIIASPRSETSIFS